MYNIEIFWNNVVEFCINLIYYKYIYVNCIGEKIKCISIKFNEKILRIFINDYMCM